MTGFYIHKVRENSFIVLDGNGKAIAENFPSNMMAKLWIHAQTSALERHVTTYECGVNMCDALVAEIGKLGAIFALAESIAKLVENSESTPDREWSKRISDELKSYAEKLPYRVNDTIKHA